MKQKTFIHVVVIVKLFTPLWLKQLNKAADCHFIIPATHKFWGPHNFEHLVVAFVFPFLPFRPWQLKGTPKMFSMGRQLCKVFREKEVDPGNFLFKFLLECRELPSLSPNVVWKVLYFGKQTPFPCRLPGDQWREKGKRQRDCGGQSRERKIKKRVEDKVTQ